LARAYILVNGVSRIKRAMIGMTNFCVRKAQLLEAIVDYLGAKSETKGFEVYLMTFKGYYEAFGKHGS
jgi:hypothetical protein